VTTTYSSLHILKIVFVITGTSKIYAFINKKASTSGGLRLPDPYQDFAPGPTGDFHFPGPLKALSPKFLVD